jgi:HAE1 family hydrophobic/amphiphilic exporter-1
MLGVGMVVDNAIVVVESVYLRRQAGEGAEEAAIAGTAEVNLAVTLSTLTSMVVFLPIILMSEDADFSFFMGQLGMPVVWALAASLFVALIFTPLSTTFLKGKAGDGLPPEPRWILRLVAWYQKSLNWILRHRTDSLVGLLAALFLTFVVPVQSVGCEEDAEGNINDFVVSIEVPTEFSYTERLDTIGKFEKWVDEHDEAWQVRTHRAELDSWRKNLPKAA